MKKSTFKQTYPQFKKLFLILFLIYGLAISAIVRADFQYIDDLGRTIWNYQGWDYFSRYISVFSSSVLHTDTFLTDISPLTQYLAMAILALSSTLLIYIFAEDSRRISPWLIAAVLPLGLSPYILECISYKYDAPYMALSVLAMVFPLWFEKRGYKVYLPAVFLGSLMMCMTYQAASGIFPMMVVALCFARWNRKENFREILKFALLSALAYGLGLIVFKVFIMHPVDEYVATAMLPFPDIIKGSLRNLKQYYKLIVGEFRPLWKVLIGVIVASYVLVQTLQSSRNKLIAFLGAVAAVLAMAALAFGVYIALVTPAFDPRAMYGFGVLIAILAVQCCDSKILDRRYLIKLACLYLSWSFIVFSFTYGNMLTQQQRYADFRINMVISDLDDCDVTLTDTQKTIKLSGDSVRSPVMINVAKKYPILNRLVPDNFSGAPWYWQNFYFYYYFGLKNMDYNAGIDMESMNLPVLKDSMYHTIRSDGTYILIELKN